MTEITLEREILPDKAKNVIIGVVSIMLMAIGLYLCYNLFNWAIGHRLSSVEVIEQSTVTAKVRERQLACLAKNIYHEAGGEPFEGKVAVAQVTINRAESDGLFPGDICKVVFQKNIVYEKVLCQFSWVCDRSSGFKPKHPDIYDESYEVAKKVLLEGFRLPALKDALYFHADYVNPGWNKKRVAKIGRHIFYN